MLIFTWLIYILAEAKIQHYLIETRKWKPNYIQLFIIRGMAGIIHGILIDVGSLSHMTGSLHEFQMWQYKMGATLIIFQCCSFWLIFDLTLNYLRNRPIDYRGKSSGWLDRLPYPVWLVGKFVAINAGWMSAYYYIVNS